VPLLAALAIGGSLARKKTAPASAGTFRTDGPTFVVLLVGVITLTAGLMIMPALTLAQCGGAAQVTKDLIRSIGAVIALTVVFGFAYPAVMVGFASAAFPNEAGGSLIHRDGKVVGSKLAAQEFKSPRYFHERPSGTAPAYNARATTFLNLGPTNPDLAKFVHDNAKAILDLESPYNPSLTIHDIPVDAVVTSGSGIDPDISPANAALQSRRVAAVRALPLATVQKLIDDNTHGRSLGFFGEPGVNVLELNLALDQENH